MELYTSDKKPYWTEPGTILPWRARYRLRIDDNHVIQAAGSLLSGRWKATLYLDTAYGLFPVARTRYRTDPSQKDDVQKDALSAMVRHAEKSRRAREVIRAVGHALTAMGHAPRKDSDT